MKTGEDKVTEEDAGVLISIVLDSARSTSFVLVLNAQDLKVLARIELNKLIPLSFAHGSHRLRSI
jgi:carotenoid cleavage dioxygenase-like enzyme